METLFSRIVYYLNIILLSVNGIDFSSIRFFFKFADAIKLQHLCVSFLFRF